MSRFVRITLAALIPASAVAHMVSISTGELRIDGATARYELRMPLYEVEVMAAPQRTLFEHIHFTSRGEPGKPRNLSCRVVEAEDSYVCDATYTFSAPVKALDIECTFYQVTVPNHIQILRARKGKTVDQAVFDFTAPSAEINFVPPSFWQTLTRQTAAGARRAAGGLASLLFLLALVIAGRNRRELLSLAGMFLAGQLGACMLAPLAGWEPAPGFVEAAAALTIAYLAVEILLLPKAGQRWLIVGVLGAFHGLYLELFLRGTGFHAGYVLTGAFLTELAFIALLGLLWKKLAAVFPPLLLERVAAAALLLFGLSWFVPRLRG